MQPFSSFFGGADFALVRGYVSFCSMLLTQMT